MNRLNHVSHFILLILASIIIFMLNMIFSFTPITNNSDIYNGQTQTEITSFLDFSEMLLLMTGLVLIIVAVMNVTANLKKIIEIKRWFFYFGLYLLILLVFITVYYYLFFRLTLNYSFSTTSTASFTTIATPFGPEYSVERMV